MIFQTFGLDGCLSLQVDEWMMEHLYGAAFVEKENFCGVVQPMLSCGISRIKEIARCSTISSALLILFGLFCSIRPLGGVRCTNYTRLFCNYNLLMIINNWKALIVMSTSVIYSP